MDTLKTGTTTIGLVAKDAIVLCADKRATAGSLIADKRVTKIIPINERLVVTIAGVVSDIQLFTKYLKAELKLKDLKTGTQTSVKAAANLLSGFNYSGLRGQGSIAHYLLAGTDAAGVHLYEVSFDGAVMAISDYEVTGSGSVFAMGALEANYKKGLSEPEAIALAKQAVTAAIERDTGSGNGYDIYVVNKTGVHHKETVLLKSVAQ